MTLKTLLATMVVLATNVAAQETIDPGCLTSLPVKNKSVAWSNATFSCIRLEEARSTAYTRIERWSKDSALVVSEIDALIAELDKARSSENWSEIDLGTSIGANALAGLGLLACAETVGAGCAVAAVSKLLAEFDLIRTAASTVEKASVVREIEERLKQARAKLSVMNLDKKLGSAIGEFNRMCRAVKDGCL